MSYFRVNVVCALRHVLALLPAGGWHLHRAGGPGLFLRTASSNTAMGSPAIKSGWEY
jgi:hypothetical protein